jgi:glycosyltransferase involved in cell wall biosynthesis
MKIAMVNDCAFVGETILKYLPKDIEATHIKRTRGLWSKTFGIAYKILKTKADVYHVHYLLQDCYLASFFGKKPLIGHAHGSDLTATLNRFPWRRLVKSNLKKCDKILVSTPDLIEIAQQYREDFEYLPSPVDMKLFYPKPLLAHEGKLKVLIASSVDWSVKGTDIAIQALAQLKNETNVSIVRHGRDFEKTLTLGDRLGLKVNVLPKVHHQNLNEYYWAADLVIDQFKAGTFGLTTLEAIACGRPAITYASSRYEAYKGFPLKDVNTTEQIVEALKAPLPKLWKSEHNYLKQNHDPEKIVKGLLQIYENITRK